MKSVGRDAARDLLFLSLTAGSADAAGYIGLGRVFTSNMTGNIVLLGVDIGQNHFASAGRTLAVVVIFVIGVATGAWLGRGVNERDWPRLASRLIGLEKVALVLFGLGWAFCADLSNAIITGGLLFFLTLAMGLQSAAMNRFNAPGAATTAITGTLTALVTGFINLCVAPNPTKAAGWDRIKFQSGMIAVYCGGAALCGFLITHLTWLAGCLPALAALCVWPKKVLPTQSQVA
jgi:uncharacterized membrane protein YoaK (UPF0700 family)